LAAYGHKGHQAQAEKERRGGSGASVRVGRVLQGSGRSTQGLEKASNEAQTAIVINQDAFIDQLYMEYKAH
jgi:hypothetical protein